MSLRHALLVSLADREASGYELAKTFHVSVANYWHATSQQIYRELERMREEGLVADREVVQEGRPNKRLCAVTEAGRAQLIALTRVRPKPRAMRDELLIQVEAVDHGDAEAVLDSLARHIEESEQKLRLYRTRMKKLTGGLSEQQYLARGERIGPYLTLTRGITFEEENLRWARWATQAVQTSVLAGHPERDLPERDLPGRELPGRTAAPVPVTSGTIGSEV